jgi:glycosyltransferase involved in cell wall biosynthesis
VKLLCFIDSLGSGGAQRQLTTLAAGLKKRGHQVRFLVYHQEDHFLPLLQAADIPCQVIPPCSYWRRALAVRRILRRGWQDVVLAFLEASCLYAELARIPGQHWGLVAGERFASPRMRSGAGRWLRQFHRLADAVVSNSHTNQLMLEMEFPFLRRKLATVYNVVDLRLFRPSLAAPANVGSSSARPLRIVVAASYHEKKNMMGVASALLCLKQNQSNPRVVVHWFGAVQPDPTPFKRVERFVADNGLGEALRLYHATRDIADEFSRADAVGLFSFFEGLPNAVCEGMACGKPILLSNVCDAGNLVRDGKNGFLCDPTSPESMAKAFERLAAMSFQERCQMGLESRALAEELFGEQIVLDRYEKILEAAARHGPVPAGSTRPAQVPASAVATVEQWASSRSN